MSSHFSLHLKLVRRNLSYPVRRVVVAFSLLVNSQIVLTTCILHSYNQDMKNQLMILPCLSTNGIVPPDDWATLSLLFSPDIPRLTGSHAYYTHSRDQGVKNQLMMSAVSIVQWDFASRSRGSCSTTSERCTCPACPRWVCGWRPATSPPSWTSRCTSWSTTVSYTHLTLPTS